MQFAELALGPLLIVFMAGSLLGLGLDLRARDALAALWDARFAGWTLAWGWLLGPACAWAIVHLVPMAPGYGAGLMLLSLAPAAPFVPALAIRAGGDVGHVGAVMLLTAVGTVVVMPIAVPLVVPGLTAGAWQIGRPLMLFILLPLAAGMALRAGAPKVAVRLRTPVKAVTSVATLLMLLAIAAVYGGAMLGAVGSFAIAAQVLCYGTYTLGGYFASPGLARRERVVLSLAMGTRNIGAAFAPLVAVPNTDPQPVVMCAIATLVTFAVAAFATMRYATARCDGSGTPEST
jgi:BASS family bile acid:Na+ symporter